MPTLTQILTQQAEYTRRSGYRVEVNTSMPWVSIIDNGTDATVWFMQGDDAQKYCDECEATYNKVGDMSLEDVQHAYASQYIDSLEG